MSINKRKHIRLTLNIPAFRVRETGEKIGMMIYQISIGGCFLESYENIRKDEEFRLEIQLPNKNWLPLQCQVLHIKKSDGIGVRFQEITKFEQELIARIMTKSLADDGIPLKVDPFSAPKIYHCENNQL